MNLHRKSFLTLLLAGAVPASFSQNKSKGLVGILMPTMTSQRWVTEGLVMMRQLDKLGYASDLKYANDDINLQIKQIEDSLKKNAKALIISAIDGKQLAPALAKASAQGVKIISYDRLIRDTANVDFYATFDNFQVGVLHGNDIVTRLGLDKGKGPFNIEVFAGSSDDNNSFFFYNGAMSVLQSYIDTKRLVVQSGQIGMDKVATQRWSGTVARTRLSSILEKNYTTHRLDAILSPYDGITIELINAVKNGSYSQKNHTLPVITGQDAESPSVRAIIRGEQSSTVFKDTRALAQVVVTMVDNILTGKKPEINDEKTYNNGVKVIPAFLLKPQLVDATNWKKVLIDSGYYRSESFR